MNVLEILKSRLFDLIMLYVYSGLVELKEKLRGPVKVAALALNCSIDSIEEIIEYLVISYLLWLKYNGNNNVAGLENEAWIIWSLLWESLKPGSNIHKCLIEAEFRNREFLFFLRHKKEIMDLVITI